MKTALVTGAAKRIGRAIAERLLQEGYQLVLHAHTSAKMLDDWVQNHSKRDHVIDIVHADLSDAQGQEQLVKGVQKVAPVLDLIVHNASAFSPLDFANIDRHAFDQMLGVNLYAPFFVTQGLLPQLFRAASPSMINIVDAMWQRPSPQFSHYAISKAGLAILTRALANELAPKIRVNAVAPGAILFPPFYSSKERDEVIDSIPFKQLGDPDEIAKAVVFLSETSRYVTGEILVVDGGRSTSP